MLTDGKDIYHVDVKKVAGKMHVVESRLHMLTVRKGRSGNLSLIAFGE